MHTRQGAAAPAQPKFNAAAELEIIRQLLAPIWAPLEKLCPPGLCEQFMFMGSVDGVYLYKHVDSRRYLNIDAAGRTYAYYSGRYYPVPVAEARHALAQPEPIEDLFTPSERRALMLLMGEGVHA